MTAVLDWPALTADQQTDVLTGDPQIDFGCELLDFDLNVTGDLSDYLQPVGTVQWTGANTVHRACDVTLSKQLAWGIDLIRLYAVETLLGFSVRVNLGVFCMQTPDQPLDSTTEINGETCADYQISGQDRLYLLNRGLTVSYTVASGTGVLAAVAQVFVDAGLSGVFIDSTASDATVPDDMVWPLLPESTAQVFTSPGDEDDPYGTQPSQSSTTWLSIINNLLALINYRGVFCDENGLYTCIPYVDSDSLPPVATFDADDELQSTVALGAVLTRDPYGVPNFYNFVWQNMPPDGDGNQQSPTVENGGLYQKRNDDTGLASIEALNGLIFPTTVELTAASADDLAAQGDARYAADLKILASLGISTAPFLIAGHFDVLLYADSNLPDGLSPLKVQATQWQINLDGSDTQWTLGTPVYTPAPAPVLASGTVAATDPVLIVVDGDPVTQLPALTLGSYDSPTVGDRVRVECRGRGVKPIVQGKLT